VARPHRRRQSPRPLQTSRKGDLLDAHDPYAALRHPSYRLLLCGALLSSTGAGAQFLAVDWELYHRTGDAAAIGLAGLVLFLPVLLLALPAGQAADRFSRKGLFLASQVLTGLAALGLAALSWWEGPVNLTYPCLFLSGIARALSAPSRTALLPQVVPPEALGNAVAWNSSGWQASQVAGPALGGLIIGVAGKAAPAYLFTALSALACVGLVTFVRPREAPRPPSSRTLASLLAGIRFVWRTKPLLAAITLDLFAVLLGGATALLPIYADLLRVGGIGLGWLRAAPSLGAILMGVLIAHRPPPKRPGVALVLAVAGFGAATIVFGFSTDFKLSFAMLLLAGALDNVSVVVRGTLLQTLTPDEMRGRVAAVTTVFISSSNELGAAESGYTAKWFGPVASVVGGGIGTIIVVLLVIARWPLLLRLGPLHAPKLVPAEVDRPGSKNVGT
jgi:MFS family permease